MIRLATSDDVPRLVEMGRRFRRDTSYAAHLDENADQMAGMARQLIASDGMLVSERAGELAGMIGFVLFPHFLSGEIIAGEVCWWVEPEHRGEGVKLVREAERRARLAGAKRMQMIAPNERVGGLYQRLGYAFVEAAYQKTL